jgi:hypothetical protein
MNMNMNINIFLILSMLYIFVVLLNHYFTPYYYRVLFSSLLQCTASREVIIEPFVTLIRAAYKTGSVGLEDGMTGVFGSGETIL